MTDTRYKLICKPKNYRSQKQSMNTFCEIADCKELSLRLMCDRGNGPDGDLVVAICNGENVIGLVYPTKKDTIYSNLLTFDFSITKEVESERG